MPIRVLFLIRSLAHGGAQRQLVQLIQGLDRERFEISVVTFYPGGVFEAELAAQENVRLICLDKRGRWDLIPFLWRLWRVTRATRPQLLHGYMYIANEITWLMSRLTGAKNVWGIRASYMEIDRRDWPARLMRRLGIKLSRFADLIIVNSVAGRASHVAQGYAGRRMIVVPNGIDTARFYPDESAGRAVRAGWGVWPDEVLIGLVARLDPMKDHPTFLRAAARLAQWRADVRFVCVGDGPAPYRQELECLAADLGLGERLIWAGARDDMPAVYSALDLATSSSIIESFPNVVGEAMACGVPCVATDVGDSAAIVGTPALIVPPGVPVALVCAWQGVLVLSAAERAELRRQMRQRVEREYSVAALVQRTSRFLLEALDR